MKRELLTALTVALLAFGAQAEDLIITANRAPVPAEAVNEDYAIITKEEIEKYGLTSVADVLEYVSGITLTSYGGPGQLTELYMLGLKSGHTLVMVDGVPVYDPTNTEGNANFEWLDLSNVERIEVIKGPQGALYGSEAVAGVINIITTKPKQDYLKVNLEGGKYLTFKEKLSGGKVFQGGFIGFTAENFKTNGFSATNSNPDDDGFHYTTGSLTLGYEPTDFLKLTWNAKVKGGYAEYDEGRNNYDNFFTSLKADATITDKFAITAVAGNHKEDRDYQEKLFPRFYRGIVRYLSLQPIYYLTDSTFVTGGVNYRQEKGEFGAKASEHLKSAFLELHTSLYGITATAAVRRDLHSQYGGKTTYKLSAGYLFEPTGTKIRAQYGTGFRAPSLYQLYSPSFGNPNLKAETGEGWNVGVDQELPYLDGKVSITYFKNHVWNWIDWNNRYYNIGKAITEGAEVEGRFNLTKNFSLYGNYTHLRAKQYDSTTGRWEWLPKRPKFTYTAGLDGKIERFSFSVRALHYSDRPSGSKTLGGFTTVNAYASYTLKNGIKVYARAFNLTDEDYELTYGYNTMGRALFVGASYSFK